MRPRLAPSPTRENLLAAAERLMLARGYPATTVDEICVAAGVTKGSFFHYFTDKEELGGAVLERFVAGIMEQVHVAPFQKERDPLKRVYGYLNFVAEISRRPAAQQGCLLGNFAQDLSESHPRLRKQCSRHFTQWAAALKSELDAAKAKYARGRHVDTQELAEHVIAIIEGALILAKAHQDPQAVARALGHLKNYLAALFGQAARRETKNDSSARRARSRKRSPTGAGAPTGRISTPSRTFRRSPRP